MGRFVEHKPGFIYGCVAIMKLDYIKITRHSLSYLKEGKEYVKFAIAWEGPTEWTDEGIVLPSEGVHYDGNKVGVGEKYGVIEKIEELNGVQNWMMLDLTFQFLNEVNVLAQPTTLEFGSQLIRFQIPIESREGLSSGEASMTPLPSRGERYRVSVGASEYIVFIGGAEILIYGYKGKELIARSEIGNLKFIVGPR